MTMNRSSVKKQWFDLLPASELIPGAHHTCVIQDRPIAVFNLEGSFYAIEDLCTHQQLPLSEGPIDGHEIECPFHGARFCIKTGAVTAPPAFEDLPTFEVRQVEGMLQIKIPV